MNPLHRLLLWQKFTILAVVGLILVAVPLSLFIKESRKTVSAAELEVRGLEPARAVLGVVTLMQQHRGMSAMFLAGDTTVASKRASKQEEVSAAFERADAQVQGSENQKIEQLWSSVNQRWAPLPQQVAGRSLAAQKSFAEHTAMITDLLKVNELILDHYGLALDAGAATHHLIDAALIQSPELTETLGRLRGRGAGVLTAGSATGQELAMIAGMHARAEEIYARIESALDKAKAAAPGLQGNLDGPLRQSLDEGRAALKLTHEQIVLADALGYSASEYFAALSKAIAAQLKLYEAAVVELDRMLADRQWEMQRTQLVLVGIVLMLAIAAGVIGILITRSVTVPLQTAIKAAGRVAAGDLTVEIEVRSKNEVSQLLAALKDMTASLRNIVSEVHAGSDAIASASAQIAEANMDLSGRTEEQASALEETASSMEEVTGTVRQNADSARQANALAHQATQVATRGGEMVGEVVKTMSAIDASSRKVAEITNVINGIAFQTNILALNAAVEAARAGEQGRGFAVVAQEVRNLAQRSANAAKEIEHLIKDSVQRAADGAKLAAETGGTMEDIVTSIRHVSQLVEEIAQASDEQTQGIAQVNQAVSAMDATTQQNAALVEEAAAAAEALKDQAADLAQLVSVFKVGYEEQSAPTAVMSGAPTLAGRAPLRLAA